jgi:predicted CxxxxCH...CXXCH cytochrome family protein
MRTRLAFPLALGALAALGACSGSSKGVVGLPVNTTCTSCHGSGDNSAPPASATGTGSATWASLSPGAHQTHVLGVTVNGERFRKPVACSECHPVPLSNAQANEHRNGVADVVFGPLASNGGLAPAWNPATPSCSATYCHGGTLQGGSNTSPVWTRLDGTQVTCGTCHGIPPSSTLPDPAGKIHPVVDATIPGYDPADLKKSCNACHPGTVKADGTLDVPGGQHIDGVVEIGAYACARCHGDPSGAGSWWASAGKGLAFSPAPPYPAHDPTVPATGPYPASTTRAVGAHVAHLTGTTLSDTSVACSECHAVPTSMLAHPNPAYSSPAYNGGADNIVVDMTWGPLASAGGAVPAWNTATLSCSTTYCHGGSLVGGSTTSPTWTGGAGQVAGCAACHGDPPPDAEHAFDATKNPTPNDCSTCHTGYNANTASPRTINRAQHIDGYVEIGGKSCTFCHGTTGKTNPFTGAAISAALQSAPGGTGTDTADRAVGAHDAHLFGTTLRAAPIACTECHVEETSTDHPLGRDVSTFNRMSWGPLATAGGSHPAWTGPMPPSSGCPPGGCTCATTYCHGSTLSGGNDTAPVWNLVVGDPANPGSQVQCGSCHGDPPPLPHDQRSDCGTCHTGYTSTSVNLEVHIDGVVDAAGSCTSCHGDPTRAPSSIAPAPPANAAGGAWAASDPGAHQKHLTGTLLRSAPIACAECHAVPTGPPAPAGSGDTHGDGIATVAFGALATTDGARPTWNTTVSLGCAASYCHGGTLVGGTDTAPLWTETGGAASACGACHGTPPATPEHAGVTATTNCNGCHTGYNGTAAAGVTVNAVLHIDGKIDATGGSCTSCHGDSTRVLLTGADAQTASAPPLAANSGGPWPFSPGAHLAHLNKGTGAIGKHVACSECHVVPASSAPSATHENGAANVSFGTLAKKVLTLSNGNPGTAIDPTYDAGSATVAPSCSTTYCHGQFTLNANSKGKQGVTIAWNVAGPLACSACHNVNGSGVPVPNDSCHPPNFNHDGGNRCSDCHKNVNSTGTAVTNANTHVDGVLNGKCTDCHSGASLGSSKNRICQ